MSEYLLEIENLVKYFAVKSGFVEGNRGVVHAVDNIFLSLKRGEPLGLVGESGCGKTTLGRLIARLEKPDAGKITFGGREIGSLKGADLKKYWSEVQMVFQDPFESLNPRRTV